jgi:hypothetical protein
LGVGLGRQYSDAKLALSTHNQIPELAELKTEVWIAV